MKKPCYYLGDFHFTLKPFQPQFFCLFSYSNFTIHSEVFSNKKCFSQEYLTNVFLAQKPVTQENLRKI